MIDEAYRLSTLVLPTRSPTLFRSFDVLVARTLSKHIVLLFASGLPVGDPEVIADIDKVAVFT